MQSQNIYYLYTATHTYQPLYTQKTQNNKKTTWPLFEKRAQSTHYNAKEKYS